MAKITMAGPWVTEHEVALVCDALRNGWYDEAYKYVELFEKEFARYHGRKFGLMTPNCTTALHLLLAGLGIGEGDEVIVPECTWIGSVASTVYQRATPVFCDIDPISWCLSTETIIPNITSRTKAIIVVDLFGNMPDMDSLSELCRERNILLIEDAAEAVGSRWRGKRAGSFGVGSVFSFHRTKTITTGEGGILLLDDRQLFERCAFLRDHGRRPGGPMYVNDEVTFKYMPSNIQAALAYGQFQRIDELVEKKRQILGWYRKYLGDLPDFQLNPDGGDTFNGAWITAAVIGKSWDLDKATAIQRFAEGGLPLRPFFYPLSSLPAFGSRGHEFRTRNPTAYDVSARGVNLPGAMNLEESDVERVCRSLRKVMNAP